MKALKPNRLHVCNNVCNDNCKHGRTFARLQTPIYPFANCKRPDLIPLHQIFYRLTAPILYSELRKIRTAEYWQAKDRLIDDGARLKFSIKYYIDKL
jgi:hypothetical protein